MNENNAYVELRYINKYYGGFQASKDVNIRIPEGKLVALVCVKFFWANKCSSPHPALRATLPARRGGLCGTSDRENVTILLEMSRFVPPPRGGGGVTE